MTQRGSSRPSPAIWLFALALVLGSGCSREAERAAAKNDPAPAVARVPSVSTIAPPPAAAPPARMDAPPPPPPAAAQVADSPGCRVMSVTGTALRAGAPVRAGDKLSSLPALELGAGAVLRLMHTTSTRQWTVTGPARLVACDRGAEEIVIARGALRIEAGAGVRPGAEVWLGTPFGSLRYSDGRADIDVSSRALDVRVASGQLWFAPLGGESRKEQSVRGPSASFAAKPYRVSGELATARCARAARRAEERAAEVLSVSPEPLGARAAEHVRARQQAHATCASALASLLADEPVAAGVNPVAAAEHTPDRFAELARYAELWRRVPERPRSASRD